ncbi:MAG: phytoene desaturase [Myxococcota bacterium]|jgi:phytoene desaturase
MSSTSQAPHAIVIGAGFGGMASAIRLRAKGYRVTLLEANEQLGGRASVWRQDGFTFDAGPTVITAPWLFDELFEAVGRRAEDYFELMPVDPFYRVDFSDGSSFDFVGEEDRLLSQIEQMSPQDVDGYRKMADHARRIFEKGYQELAHVPFDTVGDMLRITPDLVKLRCYKSVYALVSDYIKDERLRQVFTFEPLLVGGNPFRCSGIYLLIHWLERKWGVHYARGGTTAIVSAMGRLMQEIGVDIHLNTPVESIEVTNGRASGVFAGGRQYSADLVVANGDPSTVYTQLIDKEHRRKHTDRRVTRMKQSMSLFVLYFGTDRTYENLAHHTIILGDRYKGLLTDIFDKKILPDDFSLYLHAPTRSDASVAPAGHESFYVLSPVPNQRSGLDWEALQSEYTDRILTSLEQTHLPGLRKHLVTTRAVDPRYFEGRLRSYDGAAFGPEPRLTQSAWFRYHNRSEDVSGLYFVGAGTHPGAGVPGVLGSAKVLDSIVPAVQGAHRQPIPERRTGQRRVA